MKTRLRFGVLVAIGLGLLVLSTVVSVWLMRGLNEPDASLYPPSTPKMVAKPFTFPNGGRTLFPNYRLIALYGSPDMPALGALGEQSADASIARVKQLAAQYQPLMTEHAMPALEMIATVASATPTANNDYSQEVDMNLLWAWEKTARANGVYVVLDLQPGRSDFLTQAKEYRALLAQPNVGLALDPEWRLGPNQVPVVQIGTVNITEVNQTIQWLSQLTAEYKLPQKLVVLHQFQLDMISARNQLDTSHANLAYVVQMDGNGTPGSKQDTWRTITADAPPNVHFGWKDFYKVDSPILDPAATMAVTPKPWYVSYQ